jgi:iron-sulfur cluster assembly protein
MSITLTEQAAAHVSHFLGKDNEAGLRVGVKPTGCSGYAYVVEPAKQVDTNDAVFESHGVKLVVDTKSLDFLSGTVLDYVREGMQAGFKFHNPNVKNTCGCGESFTV